MSRARSGRLREAALIACLAYVAVVRPASAQTPAQTPARGTVPAGARGECPAVAAPAPPSEVSRRSARDLAARAQEAAIVADNATARDLYRRAAALDPTDPTTAYALARAYEAARDARAIAEYCRFLALSPSTPDSADVRRRIAALSYELLPRTAAAGFTAGVRRPPLAPGAAFTYGILFPGSGQYYTRRPAAGLLATAAAAGALFYGFRSQLTHTLVRKTCLDAFGVNEYECDDVQTHTRYPHMAAGVATAAGISLAAAVEAYLYARRVRAAQPSRRADARTGDEGTGLDVVATPAGVGLALRVPVSPSR